MLLWAWLNLFLRIKTKVINVKKTYQHVFKAYYRQLCNFAFTFVKDKDVAEDVVQDVFLKFWKKIEGLENQDNLKSYLYTSTRNRAIEKLRKKREEYGLDDKLENIPELYEDKIEQTVLLERVYNTIKDIPGKSKRVFELSKLRGFTYQEIADELNISVKTVESHMVKALKFLREQLYKD